jgi:ubiquinone/menaquinone biosynthesis C-methylase UbiE
MSTDAEKQHLSKIVDQFLRQAIPFMELNIHMDAMDLLVEMSGVNENDTVLDVACGPGLVVCEFAKHASSVTGIDITEAMIGKAREIQNENKLDNVDWATESAYPLPFDDGAFTLVLTRYGIHHFLEPARKHLVK